MTLDQEFYKQRFSLYDFDPPSPVMDNKLVINVAPTGAFIKREQNPNQAYTPVEVAKQAIESYKVGASVFHIHVRNEKGIIQLSDVPAIKEAVDRVLDECPDMIFSQSGHSDVSPEILAGAKALVDPLTEAERKSGRRYIHTQVLLPMATALQVVDQAGFVETVQYVQDNNIVPEFQIDNYRALYNTLNWVIRPGILKKPHIINFLAGLHGPTVVGPGLPDPWGRIHLMTMFMGMKQMLPNECVFGATVGGRHWLPAIVEAIMLGVNCVRIGMEDTLWMYPHKEDRIRSCADVVNKVATIARELGREVATPSEAREILGVS